MLMKSYLFSTKLCTTTHHIFKYFDFLYSKYNISSETEETSCDKDKLMKGKFRITRRKKSREVKKKHASRERHH